MQTIVRLFLLLVITTLVTGYKLPHNDPGTTLDDSDSPVDELTYNDHGSDTDHHISNIIDFPFDGENDPGSA